MENLTINTMADVRCFFYYLIHEMELGAGFHPDTPMSDYVNTESKQPTFSPAQALKLQLQMDQCYHVCYTTNNDIYEQGVEPRAYIQMLDLKPCEITVIFGEDAINNFEEMDTNIDLESRLDTATHECGYYEIHEFDTKGEKDAYILGLNDMNDDSHWKVIV